MGGWASASARVDEVQWEGYVKGLVVLAQVDYKAQVVFEALVVYKANARKEIWFEVHEY